MKKKSKVAVKEPVTKKTMRSLPCKFTDDEIRIIGRQSADAEAKKRNLVADKKSTAKSFDARIAEVEAQISVCSDKIITGSEYRQVECVETMDVPTKAKKTIVRQDTKETVEIEAMTYDELNPKLIDVPPQPKPGQPLNPVAAAFGGDE